MPGLPGAGSGLGAPPRSPFRGERPGGWSDPGAILSYANLFKADLSHAKLSQANLSSATLSNNKAVPDRRSAQGSISADYANYRAHSAMAARSPAVTERAGDAGGRRVPRDTPLLRAKGGATGAMNIRGRGVKVDVRAATVWYVIQGPGRRKHEQEQDNEPVCSFSYLRCTRCSSRDGAN